MKSFKSKCEYVADCALPAFTGIRIMMMPLVIGDMKTIPDYLHDWKRAINRLFDCDFYRHGTDRDLGRVGYLTIDEKEVRPGETHRRAGLHVDGGEGRGWGGGGGWASRETGMLTVSNVVGCWAWNQSFSGWPGEEGNCEHLRPQLREDSRIAFLPGTIYWADGFCVHESIPQTEAVKRQFVRLSLPSEAPWFEGYTENPLGVLPTGPILPRRTFMDQ